MRKETDGQDLKKEASDKLTPIFLDVTDGDSVAAAVDTVAQETGGELYGLVNNAGIGYGGPLEMVPISDTRNLIEVNLIGLLAVTQAFVPLLRQGKGRIVNMSSVAGIQATPGTSSYSASKFAVQGITNALRLEFRPFGMFVTSVLMGAVESDIHEKGLVYKQELLQKARPEIRQLYAPLIDFGLKMNENPPGMIPAEEIVKAVVHAFTAKKPKYRYLVGAGAKGAAILARFPAWFQDWILAKAIYK